MSEFISETKPSVAVVGGGTGSFTLLSELKNRTPNISAVVNMSDDGGSSGRLRDELGVLPPGDIRQCLVALSDSPDIRDMFAYRFGEQSNGFEGHSLGNIVLSAFELKYGCFEQGVKAASSLLKITGEVVPVTTQEHTLVMLDGQRIIKGEHNISEHNIRSRNAELFTCPEVAITGSARRALTGSDLVLIAPGNTFGSILPIFTVHGVKESLQQAKGKVVMAANLVNKPGQTDDWHVADYIQEVERYLGPGVLDAVIYNNGKPDAELLNRYAHDGEHLVDASPSGFRHIRTRTIGAPLVAKEVVLQDRAEGIKPTYIRHDAKALWDTAFGLL